MWRRVRWHNVWKINTRSSHPVRWEMRCSRGINPCHVMSNCRSSDHLVLGYTTVMWTYIRTPCCTFHKKWNLKRGALKPRPNQSAGMLIITVIHQVKQKRCVIFRRIQRMTVRTPDLILTSQTKTTVIPLLTII